MENFQQNNVEPQIPVTEPAPPTGGKKMSSGLIIGLVALVVVIIGVALAFILYKPSSKPEPQSQTGPGLSAPLPSSEVAQPAASPEEDSTTSINQQLNDTTVEDVDSQFKDVDTDLNQL